MENGKREDVKRPHILLVPFPSQGHINPFIQFSKRLAYKGLKVTLALTVFLAKTMPGSIGQIRVDSISDGFDERGRNQEDSPEVYFESFKIFGSKTLLELIKKQERNGDHVNCIVYDPVLPWVLDVTKEFKLLGAPFFTQSCAVNSIYYHAQRGDITIPVTSYAGSVPGLPKLFCVHYLPSFISGLGLYASLFSILLNQFSNIEKADWVFVNSFDSLEQEVVNWMEKLLPIKTIGPTVPSMYLDKRIESDKEYGLSLLEPSRDICINWLDKGEPGSVIYVSFGSVFKLGEEQMEELTSVLKENINKFLWVVKKSEENKLPKNFVEETSNNGLVVSWCPQLEVLSHKALGCFVTHCGWNSTLEALSLGVPMVTLPQWSDQPTNAKYVEDVWEVGLRAKAEDNGIVRRNEIERCIREIMEGEKGKVIKRNASKWKVLAREAVDEGGSSNKNIEEFVTTVMGT